MKILLIVIGKTDAGFVREGIAEYEKRLKHYVAYEMKVIPDVKNVKNMSEAQQKEREGELIMGQLDASDYVVLLDERGEELDSRAFSGFLARKMLNGVKRLVFLIGGPYGFSGPVYARADMKISLSRMTFSHQLVRVIFTEQLYRAMTILKGEPYHHD